MTASIDEFAAIRGASASPRLGSIAGIRTLFRKWLGSYRIEYADDYEADEVSAGLALVTMEIEALNVPARTLEDFAMKAIMAWFRANAGAEMDLVESLKDDSVRLLAEVDDRAYANLAEMRP
jgi:hypothetical protein